MQKTRRRSSLFAVSAALLITVYWGWVGGPLNRLVALSGLSNVNEPESVITPGNDATTPHDEEGITELAKLLGWRTWAGKSNKSLETFAVMSSTGTTKISADRALDRQTLVSGLRSLGLTEKTQPDQSDIVFLSSFKQFDSVRQANKQAWISLIKTNCIWGSTVIQRKCMQSFAQSRLCELSELGMVHPYYRINHVDECLEVFKLDLSTDLALFHHPANVNDADDEPMAVGNLAQMFGLGEKESPAQFCKSHRVSEDVIEVRPRQEQIVTVNLLIASMHPLVVFADKMSVENQEDATNLKKLAQFVAEVAQRDFVQSYREETSAFQMLSVILSRTTSKELRLVKVIPDGVTPTSAVRLIEHALREKVWGDSHLIAGKDSSRVSIVVDQRKPLSDNVIPHFCDFKARLQQHRPSHLMHRSFPKCGSPSSERILGSRVSCSDLAWNDPETFSRRRTALQAASNPRVCGASIMISPEALSRADALGIRRPWRTCSGFVSFTQAQAFCRRAGARLCTFDELTVGRLAYGTGCEGDRRRLWTQTICSLNPLSYWTVPGQPPADPRAFPVKCVAVKDVDYPPAMARCCADEAEPICLPKSAPELWRPELVSPSMNCTGTVKGSDLTCLELRFRYPDLTKGNAKTQAELRNPAGDRVCGKLLTRDDDVAAASAQMEKSPVAPSSNYLLLGFQAAQHLCLAKGARLCSAEEVLRGGSSWAGNDWKTIKSAAWTSDDCPNGFVMAATPASSVTKCVDPGKPGVVNLVLCCGDDLGRYCDAS